ncbi:hypothetical protein BDE27_1977 [Xenorhabdus ehlersii]|uniref:DUF2007 domain-containing protein n=2 Tax=Morganellaceae TaxID=1903414 RepID=A0A2D0IWZ6_9GAMM|nr:hypothetical protein [Xenorhabdus sp. TS4]PHM26463.1 hypothetical protein Xehl_00801 [Xenorhabdus ehlersii]RKE91710.1 hypothetical protein BDE27_1977 [Xenorhabdus ehlersii]
MQLLANFLSPIDAYIVLGRMLSEDIYAIVMDEGIVWNNYMYSQAFGGVKLLVHHADIEHAKAILAEIDNNKFLLDTAESNQDNKKKSPFQYRFSVLINTFLVLLLFLILGIALPLKN